MNPADKNKAHGHIPGATAPAVLGTPPDLHGSRFKCLLCRSREYFAAARSVTGHLPFAVYKCVGCGFSFADPAKYAKS